MSRTSGHAYYIIALCFAIILMLSQAAFSQKIDIQFDHISIDDGLSQSSVNCIIQDKKGFMWFGTKDGLNKYDGYNFTVYRRDPQDSTTLSNNFITATVQDKYENIWVATHGGGLNKFNYRTGQFEHFFYDPNAYELPPTSFIADLCIMDSILWIGTLGAGLIEFNINTYEYKQYKHDPENPKSLAEDFIRFIILDSTKTLWIGTENTGISVLDKTTGTFTNHDIISPVKEHSVADNKMRDGFVGENGIVWLGSERGLFSYDPNMKEFKHLDFTIDLHIAANALYQMDTDHIWIGAHNRGLIKYNIRTEEYQHLEHDEHNPNSLTTNAINAIHVDRTNNLWIGLDGGGIERIDLTPKFKLYRHIPHDDYSLQANSIRAILEDHLGRIYIGTYFGLARFDRDNNTAKYYEVDNSDTTKRCISSAVYSLLEDSQHQIWIGFEGSGLQRYDPTTEKFIGYTERTKNLTCDDVYRIIEDEQQRIWIGTRKGLGLYIPEGDSFRTILQNNKSLRDFPVRAVVQADESHFWVGTDLGLYFVNVTTGEFKSFLYRKDDDNTLNNNRIRSLWLDDEKVLWIGTDGGGLNKLEYENEGLEFSKVDFNYFTNKAGVANKVVYGILPGPDGQIWYSTNDGLFKFDTETKVTVNYTYEDGLQSNEFNSGAYYKSPSGEMFFGGINGLNSFYADEMNINTTPPPVVITRINVLNEPLILQQEINTLEKIELPHTDDFISFEFAALDYNAPEKNQYKYQLVGFDEEWINSNERRFANYTCVPYGNYNFRVMAANNDGVWNEEGTSIAINIIPPFWTTLWFKILIAFLIIAIITTLAYLRFTDLQKKQLYLEDQVKLQVQQLKNEKLRAEIAISKAVIQGQNNEQKRISEDLHDGLGQTLTATNFNLMVLEEELNKLKVQPENLKNLKDLVNSAILEVRNISHNLMPGLLEDEGLEAALDELCNRASKISNVEIVLRSSKVPRKLEDTVEFSIYRIVQEIIANTMKHAAAKKLSIALQYDQGILSLITQDDGIGFDYMKNGVRTGGMGLSNIAARVELLKGNYTLESSTGEGTQISIHIPA